MNPTVTIRRHILRGLFLLVVLLALPATAAISQDQDSALVLSGARIYPGPDVLPIFDGAIVVQGGKIVAVGARDTVKPPAGARTLDCTGLVITAGFQNSHVHFTEAKWADAEHQAAPKVTSQLQEMLTRYGFTTVVDTASLLENTTALRKRIESGEIAGPRILTAGAPLYPPNGVPYYLKDTLPAEIVKMLPQPSTQQLAEEVVRRDIAGGADITKL
ncbi:MAG TPA: amidohydrolase family protein, partial [Thermoanaerobaculia bacterium]|nr:amidohydrolase family protein [Thermoanaerobaculia bacterium]